MVPTYAISAIYLRRAFANPVTWVACMAIVFVVVAASTYADLSLARAGIQLTSWETLLFALDSPLTITWGLLVPFSLVASPMVRTETLASLIGPRAGSRGVLWRSRLVAVALLAFGFAVAVFVAAGAATAPDHGHATHWSDEYANAVGAALADSAGTPPPICRAVAGNGYLYTALSPLSAVGLEFGIFVLALLLVGIVCATLPSLVGRSGLSLIAVTGWILLGLVSLDGTPAVLPLLSPMPHMVTQTHSPQFPYWLSLAFLGFSSCALAVLGGLRARSERLG